MSLFVKKQSVTFSASVLTLLVWRWEGHQPVRNAMSTTPQQHRASSMEYQKSLGSWVLLLFFW